MLTISDRIIDSDVKIRLHDIVGPLFAKLSLLDVKYKIVKDNICKADKNIPIIYVVNHSRKDDTPIICNVIDKRAYILTGKQKLRFIDKLFFKVYGSIFVDRKDPTDTKLAKIAMAFYITKKNQDIIIYPEGTWLLDRSLLVYPMKWGVIEIDQDTKAQLVFVNLSYNEQRKECHVYFENPMIISKEATKKEEIQKLRDAMATTAWYRMECNQSSKYSYETMNQMFGDLVAGKYTASELKITYEKRENLDIDKLAEDLMSPVKEYPYYDYEYEQSCVYKPYPSPEEVFKPIKQLKLKK